MKIVGTTIVDDRTTLTCNLIFGYIYVAIKYVSLVPLQ